MEALRQAALNPPTTMVNNPGGQLLPGNAKTDCASVFRALIWVSSEEI